MGPALASAHVKGADVDFTGMLDYGHSLKPVSRGACDILMCDSV